MKLKYYLRGLGIGVVVTVFIMMAALGNKQPMSDAEVKARAKELGMIENTIIKDVANKEESVDEQEETTVKEQEEVQTEITEAPVEDVKEDSIEENTDESVEEIVTVSVVSGDSSWSVAKRMEEVGLVDSAKEFDAFLCGNGYDKRISVGTYEISSNATWEDMAKIITKTK